MTRARVLIWAKTTAVVSECSVRYTVLVRADRVGRKSGILIVVLSGILRSVGYSSLYKNVKYISGHI